MPCRDQVQFVFGGTELAVNCFREATGEKIGQVALNIVQLAEKDP